MGIVEPPAPTTSAIVTEVFDSILASILAGDLRPGERISDALLAERYGVSRTPVREAIQRLREIGLIEAVPGRLTRVTEVSPKQTAQALLVWIALYGALLDEVIPTVPDDVIAQLEVDHAGFRAIIPDLDPEAVAAINFAFFTRLDHLSSNPFLTKGITAVVHLIRLGSLHLPRFIDLELVHRAQGLILEGARRRDVDAAWEGINLLRLLEVPQQ